MQREDSAVTLLARVADRYARLGSYRDAGVVRRVSGTVLVRFQTAFIRAPAAFRFDFSGPDLRGFVSRVGGFVRHGYVPERATASADDLMTAIAGATGLSHGTAQTIPALLLPDEASDDWTLSGLQESHTIAAPASRPIPPWHWITGRGWNGQMIRVGIDSATLLVCQVEDDGDGRVAPTVTEYAAEANPSLSSEALTSETPALL